MTPQEDRRYTLDLRSYLAVVRHRKWTIALTTLAVLFAAIFFSYRKTPIYTADARVLVRPIAPLSPNEFFLGSVNLVTEQGLVNSEAVASVVKQNLHSSEPADALLAGLSVAVEPDSDILRIAYSSTRPAEAQRLANAFANAYLDFRRQNALQQFESETATVDTKIKDVGSQLASLRRRMKHAGTNAQALLASQQTTLATRLGILQQQRDNLGSPTELAKGGGQVVQPATLPLAPTSPNHMEDAILALFVGLAGGFGVSVLKELLDDRLRGSQDFEDHLGAPILATIPKVERWATKDTKLVTVEAPRSSPAEAYRALRTNIQFLSRQQEAKVICITSPHLGDGKTTTVANLAVTMAQAKKRVVAVSCDLRKPRLHKFFGLSNSVGVTSVLAGSTTVAAATQAPQTDNLLVIASGPVPTNPAELIQSDEMDMLIDRLRAYADFVLIDTPPMLAVADAMILGPKTDGILVVVDASATDRVAASSVSEQMQQVGGNILGGVFNNYDPSNAKYYRSDYRHYYPYQYYQHELEAVSGNGSEAVGAEADPDDIWNR